EGQVFAGMGHRPGAAPGTAGLGKRMLSRGLGLLRRLFSTRPSFRTGEEGLITGKGIELRPRVMGEGVFLLLRPLVGGAVAPCCSDQCRRGTAASSAHRPPMPAIQDDSGMRRNDGPPASSAYSTAATISRP